MDENNEKLNKEESEQEEIKQEVPAEHKEEPSQPITPDPRMYGWQIPQNPGCGASSPYGSSSYSYGQSQFPNGNPYYGAPPQSPYQPPYGAAPKKKMSKGLKAFFITLGSVVGVLLIALIVFAAVNFDGVHLQNNITGDDFSNLLPGNSDPRQEEEEMLPADPESEAEEEKPVYEIEPNTDGIKIQPIPNGEELLAKDIYAKISKSVVGITATRSDVTGESQGSGIIATEDGYVITNAHVILNSRSSDVVVTFSDEKEYEAVVVGFDKTTDLAVLKIVNTEDVFEPAEFGDSDDLVVGDWVLAIGNPGGSEYASTLTRGIVSAVNRKVGSNSASGMTYIQTDAAINPGNSGGALVNMHGQVIGINSVKIVATDFEGMGFAIPISKAKTIIDDLLAKGYVEGRTRVGITGTDVSSQTAYYYGVPQGFQIQSIDEDSAFAGTDAQIGDIITALDGETVSGINDISGILSQYNPGDQISVTLYRPGNNGAKGSSFEITITLLEDKGETQN